MRHLVRVALLVIAMSKLGGTRYQVQFFRLQKLKRKIAYCFIRSTYKKFARAFGIFCCFCFSTAGAVADAVAAACFCCGCLCRGCCCCCCCYSCCCCYGCCYCTTYCWLVLLVFSLFFQLSCESYRVMDDVQNPQKSSGYDQGLTMIKTCDLWLQDVLLLLSFMLWCSDDRRKNTRTGTP